MFGESISQKVVGVKQTLKVMKTLNSSDCTCVYIAKDADVEITQPVVELAESKDIKIEYIDTMLQLGKICHIDVGAAAALILNK